MKAYATLVLDMRRKKNNNKYPLKVRVSFQRKFTEDIESLLGSGEGQYNIMYET